jgi:beta-glucosidase/6-phospho-beta-glucosidase/beta-galactosidase
MLRKFFNTCTFVAPALQNLSESLLSHASACRVNFYREYLDSVCEAVAAGDVNLIGWYAWSLFDGFEWTDGFRRKFGLVHVQFASPQGTSAAVAAAGGGLQRTPKKSAQWLSQHFFKA